MVFVVSNKVVNVKSVNFVWKCFFLNLLILVCFGIIVVSVINGIGKNVKMVRYVV